MALKTNLEMCEMLQAAITAVATGNQTYTIGEGPESKTVTKADIGKLQVQFEYWYKRYQAETRGTGLGFTVPTF